MEVWIMMNSPLEDIEAAAMQLAPAERAHLAERLLVSLDEDDEILAAWVAEAERRGDAFDRGEMGAIDFDEAIAQARARITNRRAA
jgi:putative addiction module component (TIGR02574 family)